MQILALIVLSFYHFEGSFHFWALLLGLVLRRFSTSSSLMSFSPFSCFLWLLSLLVVFFFFFFFFFCSLFTGASHGSFLSSVCDVFGCCFLLLLLLLFFAGPSSTQIFAYWFCSHQFAELGSIHCLAFSAWACSLAFLCLAILFLTICSAVFLLFFVFFFFFDILICFSKTCV